MGLGGFAPILAAQAERIRPTIGSAGRPVEHVGQHQRTWPADRPSASRLAAQHRAAPRSDAWSARQPRTDRPRPALRRPLQCLCTRHRRPQLDLPPARPLRRHRRLPHVDGCDLLRGRSAVPRDRRHIERSSRRFRELSANRTKRRQHRGGLHQLLAGSAAHTRSPPRRCS